MNIKKVKKIVQLGESEQVEFKKSTGVLHAAFETVCAFLNGKGGVVFVGVTNDGSIVGQDIADHTKQEIASHITKIEPSAQSQINVEYVSVSQGKDVIAITVTAGNHAPYIYDGRSFQRTQSATSRMSQHRYEQLLEKRGNLNYAWDEHFSKGYNVKLLDHAEIKNTIRDGMAENRIAPELIRYGVTRMLRELELVENGKLINAAVVLYAKRMQTLYSHCEIRMIRYRGLSKLDNFVDSKHFVGNAFQILTEANFFTMRHLPVESFFRSDQGQRIDKPALPVMAIREALINAICHRNYSNRSASISYLIFDDRLELWNNGTLPPELEIKDLKRPHESYPRNKKIVNVFKSRGWIEKSGTGTLRMFEECRKHGIPEPEFKEYSGGLAVIFRFAELIGISTRKTKEISDIELTTRQKNILAIIKKQGDTNIRYIMSELEKPPSQRMVKKDLNSLKYRGFIKLKGAARNSLWVIK